MPVFDRLSVELLIRMSAGRYGHENLPGNEIVTPCGDLTNVLHVMTIFGFLPSGDNPELPFMLANGSNFSMSDFDDFPHAGNLFVVMSYYPL